jgi:hypothetical protein
VAGGCAVASLYSLDGMTSMAGATALTDRSVSRQTDQIAIDKKAAVNYCRHMQFKLLSVESDAKTTKGSEFGVLTAILYLAPANEASDTVNLCPMASEECKRACLYGAGMAGVFPSIKQARVAKTLQYLNDRAGFVEALSADIAKLIVMAEKRGMKPAVRINGTSDLPQLAREMASAFPQVQFYDYSKIPMPWKRTLANYHLTFSFSGNNLSDCLEALANGINVAVVFSTARFPETWNGFRVINGDESDLRFMDPAGVVVGLKAKGSAKQLAAGGFVQLAA